jgi:hypothetical protein
MIIVITHDPTMRTYYGNYIAQHEPNYLYWQPAFVLDGNMDQQAATVQLQQLLPRLQPHEPLCLIGHGNDQGIGDRPGGPPGTWWWDSAALAQLFLDYLPKGYQGRILLEACGQSVANLPPRVAVALAGTRLIGLRIYGHQRALGIVDPLPSPVQLGGPSYPGAEVT